MTGMNVAWKNGELVERESLVLPVVAHAVQSGFVVTEDIPCFAGEEAGIRVVFRAKDHVTSFLRSAKACMMDVPYGADKLRAAILSVAEACEDTPAFVRLMAYCENEQAYDSEFVVVACVPFAHRKQEASSERVDAVVSSWRQPSVDSLPPQFGLAASRAVAEFALQEARSRGCAEAFLLNEQGCVCEATSGCVFAVRDGVLASPPVSDDLFDSVMRDAVFSLAIDLEIPVVEERVTRADLYRAHEVFVAGDTAGVVPVVSVDGREIEAPGPITKAISERLGLIAQNALPEYADWLTIIE